MNNRMSNILHSFNIYLLFLSNELENLKAPHTRKITEIQAQTSQTDVIFRVECRDYSIDEFIFCKLIWVIYAASTWLSLVILFN